jgi:hypothetical protein
MAVIVAEATAEENSDLFFGASFAQLQDVADAYEDNEPDIVVSAHVVDNNDAADPEHVPDFVNEANNNAAENNGIVRSHTATITGFPVPAKDFELMVYHTAQRMKLTASTNVYVYNYDLDLPDLISHQHYDKPVPESIIDYSDALRFKLKCIGIHNVDDLMSILSNKTDIVAMTYLKSRLNNLGLKGI